jgi:catechol 2,3-dioxygenase-like lactoylglutathione lyase family enzyme
VFDHVTIRVAEPEESARFYDTVLATLGIRRTQSGEDGAGWDDFSIAPATDDRPPTRGLHIGFVAPTRAHVDEFWRAGTGAGYRDDGRPGPRRAYGPDYYGGFLLDPDGNSAEAVHHDSLRAGGGVDHLWIRVADLDASRRFYELVAPFAGLRPQSRPGRAQFAGASGSFSVLVDDHATRGAQLAFPAPDREAVDGFRRAALAAGFRADGEAVLDPDGNGVELVHRDR